MKKLKLAVIGQGRSGRNIHGAFLKSDNNTMFEVAYVVEKDPARRELAEREYKGCIALEDYTELFDKDVDLVVNASFSECHYPITKALLENGKNVIEEKPMGRTRYECDDLVATAERNGVMLAVFQQSLFAPFHVFTKDVIASGKLGDIKQISIRYNALSRRWDWQTLQCKVAGGLYNTGPHPIGYGLDFLGFSDDVRVAFSRLASSPLTSGDSDDYAKLILVSAHDKPVVDIEVSSLDAYSPFTYKVQGTKGTYKCTPAAWEMKYIALGENPERPVIFEPLKDENGMPTYCAEKLALHEEKGDFSGSAFDVGTATFYRMVYERLTEGKALAIDPADIAKVVSVIETAHAENPMEVLF